MYYKITNTESEVYKKLHELRTKELAIEESNKKKIDEVTGLKWDSYLGREGQQTWSRVTEYEGFQFTEPSKVDLTIWKVNQKIPSIFIPNKKTKKGREMAEFLRSNLDRSFFETVFDILQVKRASKFSFPYVVLEPNAIIIYLSGEENTPPDENVIEITKKEFESLNK